MSSSFQPRRSARHLSKLPSEPPPPPSPNPISQDQTNHTNQSKSNIKTPSPITLLPAKLPKNLPGLTSKESKLLHAKKKKLESSTSQLHNLSTLFDTSSTSFPLIRRAVDATLVFAQEEAGTALSISLPTTNTNGLLLTCSHCIAESAHELTLQQTQSKQWYLLFSSGRVVRAKTLHWNPELDLALLQITAAQPSPSPSSSSSSSSSQLPNTQASLVDPPPFPYIPISPTPPHPRTPLICIGHPGSEDLEIGRAGVPTGYDVLHISEGRFRGYAKGQDRMDNAEIGALMHDCWTYWGHSGAPLVDAKAGGLVGLHSSWDEETGMRRGIGVEAIVEFLREAGVGV